jgi:hypothetical protein
MRKVNIERHQNPRYKAKLSRLGLGNLYRYKGELVLVDYVLIDYKNNQNYYLTKCGKKSHPSRFKKLDDTDLKILLRKEKIKKILE